MSLFSWFRSESKSTPAAQPVDVDIMWGGYYVARETGSGMFGLFRLLDFNQDAYHAALFREKFSTVPSVEEIRCLSPGIGHVPLDARGLVSPPIQLVGADHLSVSDLEGYMIYLEHHGVAPEERQKLTEKLIGFSRQVPLRLRLAVVNDQLQIAERT